MFLFFRNIEYRGMIFLFNTLAIHRFKTFDYSHSRDFNRNLIEDVGRQTLGRRDKSGVEYASLCVDDRVEPRIYP